MPSPRHPIPPIPPIPPINSHQLPSLPSIPINSHPFFTPFLVPALIA